jgi:membrane protein implicated in regulation of membrane protease activity
VIENIGSFLANLSTLYFLIISLSIILVDVLLLDGLFLFAVAFAALLSGLWNFLSIPPIIQVWAIPFNIAAGLALQVFFQNKTWFKKEKLPSDRLGEIVGQKGTVVWVKHSNISTQYFFKYKENISQEIAPANELQVVKKVRLDDGSVYPLSNQNTELNEGDIVNITGFEGYAVVASLDQEKGNV